MEEEVVLHSDTGLGLQTSLLYTAYSTYLHRSIAVCFREFMRPCCNRAWSPFCCTTRSIPRLANEHSLQEQNAGNQGWWLWWTQTHTFLSTHRSQSSVFYSNERRSKMPTLVVPVGVHLQWAYRSTGTLRAQFNSQGFCYERKKIKHHWLNIR